MEIDFLGITINSQSMTMTVPQEIVDKLIYLCQTVLSSKEVSLQDLSSLIGKLIATSPAGTPACLQTRYLMMWQIQEQNSIGQSEQERTGVVDRESENKRREIHSNQTSRHDNTNRCLFSRMGCPLSGNEDRGCMDTRRDQLLHQCFRTKSSLPGIIDFHNKQETISHPFSDRQHLCDSISAENGGYTKQMHDRHCEKDMGIPPTIRDHNYCRIPAISTEPDSRLGIEACEGLDRMETRPKYFLGPLQSPRSPREISVCFQAVQPIATVYESQTGSIQPSYRYNATGLVSQIHVCFPTFQHGGSISDNHSYLGNTAMVPSTPSNVNRTPSFDSKQDGFAEEPTGRTSPTPFECFPAIGGLADFRKRLVSEGVSKRAAQLISNARSEGTKSSYESAWKKFNSWCGQRKVNPFHSPIQAVLDFLAELFDQGLAYRTIGCYRSAISAYHAGINGISVGKHPKVTALMGGVSVERPPQPKYCIWDVEQVLQFIRTLPPNQELTTKMLTLKLIMLLALSASNRCSELKALDLRSISRSDDSISFEFGCRLKHTKRGKLSPPVTYYPITCEPDLCPVTTSGGLTLVQVVHLHRAPCPWNFRGGAPNLRAGVL